MTQCSVHKTFFRFLHLTLKIFEIGKSKPAIHYSVHEVTLFDFESFTRIAVSFIFIFIITIILQFLQSPLMVKPFGPLDPV